MDGAYVSLDQAAKMLGVGKRAVRGMAPRGELEARRGEGVAGRPAVSLASVERALSRRRQPEAAPGGRPVFS